MTAEKRTGFLLGLAAKGFLKGSGSGTFITAKYLKPIKCKIILEIRGTKEEV